MRPQSTVGITIKNRLIGGPLPLICLPLMASDQAALLEQAQAIASLGPDLVEWRVDAINTLSSEASVKETLSALYARTRTWPLLFTCRAPQEGGMQTMAPEARLSLYHMAIASGQVDLIDVELSSGTDMIRELRDMCRSAGVKLVLSYHNFNGTPDSDALLKTLQDAEQSGADIAKIAVMPNNGQDVLTLFNVTWAARRSHLKIPLIAIAMGDAGMITRIAGGLFGSDITFASGAAATAPGQLPIEDLRQAWSVLSW